MGNMKSGGGVLCISLLQLFVGLGLLGIYEAYKKEFFRVRGDKGSDPSTVLTTTSTPMDLIFFLSILNNIFVFFNFILSVGATVFAVQAVSEMKEKTRDEYDR